MSVELNKNLYTKIEWINDQHQELFQRIDLLALAFDVGQGKEELIHTLKFLQDYIIVHFKDEEDFQIKYNYPHYLIHKELHAEFIKDFNKFKEQLINNGASSSLACDVKEKLTDWLINHINLVDKSMAEYLIQLNNINK